MDRVVERCCGLDVHKASVSACVRVAAGGEIRQEIREFATTTRGLLLLSDWLASFGVTLVGMEATGVYWKPIYYMLEDDFELWLLNAHHLKNVLKAGRPTLRTLSGSAGSSSTALCAPASCRPRRSGSLGTSPVTARLKNRGAYQRGSTLGQSAPRRRDKALLGRHQGVGHLRTSDARCASWRHHRPRSAGTVCATFL
jgi:hypothetical protein